jgi:hypothetical protein
MAKPKVILVAGGNFFGVDAVASMLSKKINHDIIVATIDENVIEICGTKYTKIIEKKKKPFEVFELDQYSKEKTPKFTSKDDKFLIREFESISKKESQLSRKDREELTTEFFKRYKIIEKKP